MFMPVIDSEINLYDKSKLIKMILTDIQGDQLRVPDVTVADFRIAITKSKKSVSKDQLGDYEKWTKEFGQDG